MGNSNVHNHKRCPLFLAGKAGGALRGNLHVKAADGTPMANVFLTVMQDIGLDMKTFGDSTGRFELKTFRRRRRRSKFDGRSHGDTEATEHTFQNGMPLSGTGISRSFSVFPCLRGHVRDSRGMTMQRVIRNWVSAA